MRARIPWRGALIFACLAGLAILPYLDYLPSSLPLGHDLPAHAFRAGALADNLQAGVISDRSMDWYLGINLLRHYPPLAYLPVVALIPFLGEEGGMLWSIIGFQALGIFGAFLLVRTAVGTQKGRTLAVLVGAAAFALMPGVRGQLVPRGEFTLFAASMFIPMTLYAAVRWLKGGKRRDWFFLAAAIAIQTLLHGHTTFPVVAGVLMIALLWPVEDAPGRRLQAGLSTGLALVLGVALTAFWALPFATELGSNGVGLAGSGITQLTPDLGTFFTRAPAAYDWAYLGLVGVALAGVAVLRAKQWAAGPWIGITLVGVVMAGGFLKIAGLGGLGDLPAIRAVGLLQIGVAVLAAGGTAFLLSKVPGRSSLVVGVAGVGLLALVVWDGSTGSWGGARAAQKPPADLEAALASMEGLPTQPWDRWAARGLEPQSPILAAAPRQIGISAASGYLVEAGSIAAREARIGTADASEAEYLAAMRDWGVRYLLIGPDAVAPPGARELFRSGGYSVVEIQGLDMPVQAKRAVMIAGTSSDVVADVLADAPVALMTEAETWVERMDLDRMGTADLVILAEPKAGTTSSLRTAVDGLLSRGTRVVLIPSAGAEPVTFGPVTVVSSSLAGRLTDRDGTPLGMSLPEDWYAPTIDGGEALMSVGSETLVAKHPQRKSLTFLGGNLFFRALQRNDGVAERLLIDLVDEQAGSLTTLNSVGVSRWGTEGTELVIGADRDMWIELPLAADATTRTLMGDTSGISGSSRGQLAVMVRAGVNRLQVTTGRTLADAVGWALSALAALLILLLAAKSNWLLGRVTKRESSQQPNEPIYTSDSFAFQR